jgi:hypothetical protein
MKACDGCALCCKVLSVEELRKPACKWCAEIKRSEHGRSCGIYEARPESCRIFQCMWLLDEKMQPGLRPDRCHVVFAMDDYLNGPYDPAKPRLYAMVDPDWPNAWRVGLPRLVIQTMRERGGAVIVNVGSWWRHYHDGVWDEGDDEIALGESLRMFRRSTLLPPGFPDPILDFDELMRR